MIDDDTHGPVAVADIPTLLERYHEHGEKR
jgi:ribosomal protein S28E/S33